MIGSRRIKGGWLACLVGLSALTACNKKAADTPQGSVTSTIKVIDLPHGTFAARPGSPEAALAKFLESDEAAPRTFRFNADEFAPWSDQLSPQTEGTLATIILILQAYPHAKLMIVAFTDSDGSPSANQALSQRRVYSLKKLMVTRGINPSRIDAVGMNAANPIASNATPAGRALNRRVEITVTQK